MKWVILHYKSANPDHLRSFITLGFRGDDLASVQGVSASIGLTRILKKSLA